MIDASITRADLTIDTWPPTRFDDRIDEMRLVIAEDCSVIVPTIPELILYRHSGAGRMMHQPRPSPARLGLGGKAAQEQRALPVAVQEINTLHPSALVMP
jgi:hypothetical protein